MASHVVWTREVGPTTSCSGLLGPATKAGKPSLRALIGYTENSLVLASRVAKHGGSVAQRQLTSWPIGLLVLAAFFWPLRVSHGLQVAFILIIICISLLRTLVRLLAKAKCFLTAMISWHSVEPRIRGITRQLSTTVYPASGVYYSVSATLALATINGLN